MLNTIQYFLDKNLKFNSINIGTKQVNKVNLQDYSKRIRGSIHKHWYAFSANGILVYSWINFKETESHRIAPNRAPDLGPHRIFVPVRTNATIPFPRLRRYFESTQKIFRIVSEDIPNRLRRYSESSQKIFRIVSEDNSNVTFYKEKHCGRERI